MVEQKDLTPMQERQDLTPMQERKDLTSGNEKPGLHQPKKNKVELYYGTKPFISVDPVTGEREEVATAQEDVARREKFGRLHGVGPGGIQAPPPRPISEEERKIRERFFPPIKPPSSPSKK